MTQNLRIGTSAITLTSADSDVSSNFTIPASAIQISGTTDWGYNEARVYNSGNTWIAPTSQGNNATVNTAGTPPSQSQYVGNYYNWYTATAGSGTQTIASGNATHSICPKGWRLPLSSDFTVLTNALGAGNNAAGSWIMQSSPNYFILSGYYDKGLRTLGSGGGWTSSTASRVEHSYYLSFTTSSVSLQDGLYRAYGFSVRCVAR